MTSAVCQPSGVLHDSRRLERVFARCFAASYTTVLVGGAAEPLYAPASTPGEPHRLYYREDFFASALHETAHWCIAGETRRRQVDFGYWYLPDGRDPDQQAAFESVEAAPQALEWFFSLACGWPFRLSVDNIEAGNGATPDTAGFRRAVLARALRWQRGSLPARAQAFYTALCLEFQTRTSVADQRLSMAGMG